MAVHRFGASRAKAGRILTNLALQDRRVRLTFQDKHGATTTLVGVMKSVNGNRVTVTHRGSDEWKPFTDLIKIETL